MALFATPSATCSTPRPPFFVLAFGLLEGPKEWGMRLCGFEPWIKVGGAAHVIAFKDPIPNLDGAHPPRLGKVDSL